MPSPRASEHVLERIQALKLKPNGEGRSSREISRLLGEEGINLSHVAVLRYLSEARAERQSIAQDVLRERLDKTLTSDLDLLDEVLQTELAVFRAGAPKVNGPTVTMQEGVPLSHWTGLGREIRETLTMRLQASGVDPKLQAEVEAMTDEQLDAELSAARAVVEAASR